MSFRTTDVESAASLGKLNSHLGQNSYIEGVEASQEDLTVFALFGGNAPDEAKYPHIARWYNHIKSLDHSTIKAAEAEEEDDDVDLFADETEEEKEANEKRKAELETKKKENVVVGRSSVVLDIKPYDGETDLGDLEAKIRQITFDGLEWKAAQLIPLAFGVQKLQIMCNIVDDKVSIDSDIIPLIEEFEDDVQSVDIFAFNKL